MKAAPLLAVIALFAASCRESPESAPTLPAAAEPVGKGENPASDQDFVGLSEAEGEALAKERKLSHRVVMVDGQPRPATRDYRPDRVNFEIEEGRIVRTSRG